MDKFEFDEARHLYKLNDKPITGVTSILGLLAKPALIQWAANKAIEAVDSQGETWSNGKKEEIRLDKSLLDNCRFAHRGGKEKGAKFGKELHKLAEQYLHTLMGSNASPRAPRGLGGAFKSFKTWCKKNKVTPLKVEEKVYSKRYWYAGTFDFLAEINGEIVLADIKTSSRVYPENFFQLAAYENALNEMMAREKGEDWENHLERWVTKHLILNVRKDGKIFEKWSTDYELNRRAFMGLLEVYKRLGELNAI